MSETRVHKHFVVKCKTCARIVDRCDCLVPDEDKWFSWGTCDTCLVRINKLADNPPRTFDYRDGFLCMAAAMAIFCSYKNSYCDITCLHDQMIVHVDATKVSGEDIKKLELLGFDVTDEYGELEFMSYRFGSC